jgi:hypothetical protein
MTNTKSTRPRHRGVNTKLRNCPALALETRCVFSCQSIQTKPSKSPRSKIRTSSFSSSSFNYSVESSACYPCVEESGALIYQWRDRSALLKSANNQPFLLRNWWTALIVVVFPDLCVPANSIMKGRRFSNSLGRIRDICSSRFAKTVFPGPSISTASTLARVPLCSRARAPASSRR